LGRKYGVYILLEWHAIGNPITGQTDLPEWGGQPPYHGNPYNPSMNLAVDFWHTVADRYKSDSWVIYSIFNEPSHITWREWRPAAEQLVDVIRSHNPKALVLISGINWAYDLRGVERNPVMRDNVVYEVHPYVMKSVWDGPWEQWFGFLADKYPIFAGEWGFEPGFSSDPNINATAENYGRPLLTYMASKGMSWTAWCWSAYWAPRMLASLYVPTDFGELVKDTLKELNANPVINLTVKSRAVHGTDVPGMVTLALLLGTWRLAARGWVDYS
jgi:aryl-phospho-beta-D-glucosidase BglC (GH1 family)